MTIDRNSLPDPHGGPANDTTVAPPSRTWRESLRDPWTIAAVVAAVALTGLTLWPLWDTARVALDLVWRPSGDWAAITLRTADVGHLTPLVGPYSRFGWNHPGPLLFWLLAAPYHLLGGRPESILAATALLNGVTVVGISVVAWRRGRLRLVALTMGALAILFHALGPALLRDPWNPYVTLLPLALFTLLAWSIAEGDRWMWLPLVFVGSAEVQSHIGYLPMLVVVLVVAIGLAWSRRAEVPLLPEGRRPRAALLGLTTAILVACWLPALIDQVMGTGNLGAIYSYFTSSNGDVAGLRTALHEMAGQLRLDGAPWLGRQELADGDGQLLGAPLTALIAPVVAMAVAIVAAVRFRVRSALRFQIIVLTLAVGGLIATARVVGPVYDWIVRWWWVIACLWWLSIAWTVLSIAVALVRSRRVRRAITATTAAVAAAIAFAAVSPVVAETRGATLPNGSISEILGNFIDPVVEAVDGKGPILVETAGSVRGDYGDAIRVALEAAGIDVAVSPDLVTHFGPERSTDHRTPTATLWVVSADAIPTFRDDPTMVELGGWDPLSRAERTAYRTDERLLQRQLVEAGRPDLARALAIGAGGVDREGVGLPGVDQELLRRVEATRRRGDPVAVFLGPAPSN